MSSILDYVPVVDCTDATLGLSATRVLPSGTQIKLPGRYVCCNLQVAFGLDKPWLMGSLDNYGNVSLCNPTSFRPYVYLLRGWTAYPKEVIARLHRTTRIQLPSHVYPGEQSGEPALSMYLLLARTAELIYDQKAIVAPTAQPVPPAYHQLEKDATFGSAKESQSNLGDVSSGRLTGVILSRLRSAVEGMVDAIHEDLAQVMACTSPNTHVDDLTRQLTQIQQELQETRTQLQQAKAEADQLRAERDQLCNKLGQAKDQDLLFSSLLADQMRDAHTQKEYLTDRLTQMAEMLKQAQDRLVAQETALKTSTS